MNGKRAFACGIRGAGFAALPFLASACAVGPNYKRPELPVPAAYVEQSPEGTRAWSPAEPSDASDRGRWWEAFGDEDLEALEAQVAVSNQTVAQAEARFRAARAIARGARGDLFPTVSASASVTRSKASLGRSSALPGAPAGLGTTYIVSGDFSYELDLWGRIRRNLESNVEAARATAADLASVLLATQADLAVDYFTLRGTDAELELLSTNIQDFERALQLTVDRHAQGVVSGVDVAQAQTQVETTRAQATELALSRALLEHAIAVLVGRPPGEVKIAPKANRVDVPAVPPGVPSELLERRPDVAAAERRVASANAAIGVAQAGFFPSLLLNATGGWESGSISKFFSAPNLFWSLGAAVAQTLFEGGKRIAAKEQALAQYDVAVGAYRENVLTALQEVEDALATLHLLEVEAGEQSRAVDAAKRAADLAQNRYQGGITTYLEVVTAQAIALTNERTAVQLETRRMAAAVGLVRALGGGWRTEDLPSNSAILARVERTTAAPPTSAK